eukprot:267679-Lingulodinium_polyedra.AAC.1
MPIAKYGDVCRAMYVAYVHSPLVICDAVGDALVEVLTDPAADDEDVRVEVHDELSLQLMRRR